MSTIVDVRGLKVKRVNVGAVSVGVKQPDRKADYTPSSSAEVTSGWSCTSTPPIRLNELYRNSFTLSRSQTFLFVFYILRRVYCMAYHLCSFCCS